MGVTINGVPLSTVEQWSLSLQLGTPIADGAYFYEHTTGAWGYEGGPALGLIARGLPLPYRRAPATPAAAPPSPSPSSSPRSRSASPTTPASPPPPPGLASTASATAAAASDVVINGVAIDRAHADGLARQYGVTVRPGRYWYDARCGAWGLEGGPTVGLAVAGLELGAPLRADASGGGTGVFINGRELHPLDVQALARITPVNPGRYWLDARGIGGLEGYPPLFDLAALARQAQAAAGGAWSRTSSNADGSNTHVGGDGNGFFYFMDKNTSYSIG